MIRLLAWVLPLTCLSIEIRTVTRSCGRITAEVHEGMRPGCHHHNESGPKFPCVLDSG
jgi:hypothetical protein